MCIKTCPFYINRFHSFVLTYPVDEYAWEDQVEDVEHGPPPDADVVGDVDVGLRAARVVDDVPLRPEALQLKFAVRLVVALVALQVDDAQVQLEGM